MKTPITVLQEMMMKLNITPEYECISESGPHHQALFEYRCRANGHTATATARSKKEAKQEAARHVLAKLAAAGARLPPGAPDTAAAATPAPPHSFVALLKELSEEYKLPPVEYELVGDTGPPHLRHFTVRATVGQHVRLATATTKKAARQMAAESLYNYLRENLKLTKDFVEEEALVRAKDKARERYRETRPPAELAARPCLAQRLADYHLDGDTLARGADALAGSAGHGPEVELASALSALGLHDEWSTLPRERAPPLQVVTLSPAAPPLVFAGFTRAAAATAAARYLRRVLPAPGPARPAAPARPAEPEPVDLLA